MDPRGLDAIYLFYEGYPVDTESSLGRTRLAHGAVIAVNPETGFTEYYQYGRYGGRFGKVERRPIPNLSIGADGYPTDESMTRLLQFMSRGIGRGAPVRATYYPDADYDRVVAFARGRQNDENRDRYSLFTNNCLTFAMEAIAEGLGWDWLAPTKRTYHWP